MTRAGTGTERDYVCQTSRSGGMGGVRLLTSRLARTLAPPKFRAPLAGNVLRLVCDTAVLRTLNPRAMLGENPSRHV